jgi:hypothetical protein
MAGPLIAAGLGIAAGDLLLGLLSRRSRTALAGLLAVAGLLLVAVAGSSGVSSSAGRAALAIALIFLVIGGVLFLLGWLFDRLLDDDTAGGSDDAG